MNTTYKKTQLDALRAQYKNCTACPLGSLGRNSVVFGEGNSESRLMLVGEGPGAQEDLLGKPFVGKSGALLTKALEVLNISRDEIFITNIVKCRPPQNRTPFLNEMKTCKQLLLEKQINIIQPKVICTLGSAALQGLLERPVFITKERGVPLSFKETIIVPTYHPAYILRNPTKLPTLLSDLQKAIMLSQT